MIYGNARVSTDGQSVDAQVKQLRQAGAAKVFRETASGARGDRPQLRWALAELGAGDVLFVTRLDRLARSTRDLLNTLAAIADAARASVRLATRGVNGLVDRRRPWRRWR
jgi:DNA invertase Pin-like site-specific DNA recombinase